VAGRPPTDFDLVERARRGEADAFALLVRPHVVLFRAADGTFHDYELRVTGNVLLWVDAGVTLRLEGELTKAEALALAASVR
jgi:hypothetical protein